ncbi:MAG TPA: tetratricopeptide repeat protein [Polyangiaceae bacterium]|jgi:tetratricopeptide (TPR) repeat protein|nr:tetratricopeptide repeat protein [Polyangiaceae bacterium]
MIETDFLRAELERSFELDELLHISRDLLGLDPERVGGTAAKGSFAGALALHCAEEDAVEALCDAVVALRPDSSPDLLRIRTTGVSRNDELPVNWNFGHFTLMRKLGEGRSAIVYAAQRDGRDYRLRILRHEAARDRRGLHRFLTVNRLIAEIEHEFLPQRLEAGTIDGRPYVAHELVEGETLAARVARMGPLHTNDARPLLRAVLAALSALHERRIAHGDLRLENVVSLRASDGALRVLLLDAGADRLRARPRPGAGRSDLYSTMASPWTAAPEQIRGLDADPKSDVYSFGALAFHLLTGKPPFGQGSALDAAFGHLSREPVAPSSVAPKGFVPHDMDELIERLLQKDPDRRPPNAGAVLAILEQAQRVLSIAPPMSGEEVDGLLERLRAEPSNESCAMQLESAAEGAPDKVAQAFVDAANGLGAEDTATKKDLLFRAARIQASRSETLAAAEAIYKDLVALDPEDRVAFGGLEDVRRRQGKFEELVETLLERCEHAQNRSERSRLFAEIGRLYAHEMKDREQAIVAFAQALCEDPRQASIASELERLAGPRAEAWNEVLSTVTEAAQTGSLPPEEKSALYLRAARWYADKVQRPDLALSCYQAVVALDPASDAALEGLAKIYRKAQQWSELGAVLTRRADASASPAQARDFRAEAAELLELHLGDTASARGMVEAILAEDPGHVAASNQLARLSERAGDHAALVKILERRAEAQRGDERLKSLCRIAELYELKLADDAEAERRYQAALDIDPKCLDALRGLDRLYSKADRFKDLLTNLDLQIEAAATPRQKTALWERIAAIYEEEFLDHDKAASALEELLEIDPTHDGALSSLARHYRALERWADAAALYERHERALTDQPRKLAITLQRARLLAGELNAPDRAIQAYETVLTLAPEHPQALEALARLRESAGDADAALAAIDALAAKATTPEAKGEQLLRAAKLLETRGDRDGAIDRYKQALDVNPSDATAATALREAYVARGDVNAAIQLIERALEHTAGERAKAKLCGQIAALYRNKLKDDRRAEEAAKRAVQLDPTNLEALLVLGDLALDAKRYLEAAKHYEVIAGRAESLDRADAVRMLIRYVDALSLSGSTEQALAPMDTLLRLAPDDRDALERVAQVTYEHGSPVRAAELYGTLLDRFDDVLVGEHRYLAYYRRGEALRRAGELAAAVPVLETAADLEPNRGEPLAALGQVYTGLESWDDAIRTKTRHLDIAVSDERVQLLLDIGEIASSKVGDRTQAAKSFVAALEERPDDRRILAKLMQLYSEEKDWNKLVEVVVRLADFVEDPKQRVKYLHTAAIVTENEIGDTKRALEFYEQVLALDPHFERATHDAIELYLARKEYAGAEKLLQKKLETATKADDQPAMLAAFSSLAEVYELSDQPDKSIDALEAAQTLDPDNRDRAEKLGTLYAIDPARYIDKAVAAQAVLLKQNPFRPESYKALRRLYTETRHADASWCLCQTLTLLKLAEPDEERFFKRMRPDTAAMAQAALTDDEWLAHLTHPDVDPLLTAVFALIEPAVVQKRGQSLQDLGFDERFAVDLTTHPAPVCQSLFYAGGVLGMALPPAFESPDDPGGLGFIFSRVPSISLGETALRDDVPLRPAAFIAGRQLAFLRPGSYVRQMLATGTALKSWLFAAIKLTAPHFPVAAELAGAVNEAMQALDQGIQGPARDQLTRVVSKLITSGTALDLKRWVSGIDLTADRAGFLLAHDLETAAAVVRASDDASSAVPQEDRFQELVLFSVSASYFKLREFLGITVDS